FASRGALLPHLFTLAPTSSPMSGRFNFLWHYPSGRLASPPPACIPEGFRSWSNFENGFSTGHQKERGDSPPFQNHGKDNRLEKKSQVANIHPGCVHC